MEGLFLFEAVTVHPYVRYLHCHQETGVLLFIFIFSNGPLVPFSFYVPLSLRVPGSYSFVRLWNRLVGEQYIRSGGTNSATFLKFTACLHPTKPSNYSRKLGFIKKKKLRTIIC